MTVLRERRWIVLDQIFSNIRAFMMRSAAIQTKSCLFCGKAKAGMTPLGLCPSCHEEIPWITHIRCNTCGKGQACRDCSQRQDCYFEYNRSAVRYTAGMKEIMARYKYRGDEQLRRVFGHMLTRTFSLHYGSLHQLYPFDAITYVPLHDKRLRERGFNQSKQLAEQLGRTLQIPVISMLERIQYTEKQSKKTRAERLSGIEGAFAVDSELQRWKVKNQRIKLKKVLLIDDVFTTGTTLNECARVIKQHAAVIEIFGLTWAR